MKRWMPAFVGAILLALYVLLHHSTAPQMLDDTDTKVLLQAIQARNAPFSWFVSDWPLFNHFYRPIPTLFFELDLRLYGHHAAGYGWTNAALCAGSVLALFWLLREIFDRPLLAILGALIFTVWQTDAGLSYITPFSWIALVVFVVGAIRHRKSWKPYTSAALSILFLQGLLIPLQPLAARTLAWLPGRTATSMTLFALLAMASYARFERLGAPKPLERSPSPLDPPATKSTLATASAKGARTPFAILAVILTAISLATYEQAVMLPACLLGLAIFYKLSGYRTSWKWQIGFWGLLLVYVALRHAVIPPGRSSYQAQQFRTGSGGTLEALFDIAFPPIKEVQNFFVDLQVQGLYAPIIPSNYSQIFTWIVFFTGVYQLRREWKLALTGWVLTVIAFLPMAFLKKFEHYYFWPMSLWTILVVAAGLVSYRLSIIALSPPTLQAPPRPHPAPGSLLDL